MAESWALAAFVYLAGEADVPFGVRQGAEIVKLTRANTRLCLILHRNLSHAAGGRN